MQIYTEQYNSITLFHSRRFKYMAKAFEYTFQMNSLKVHRIRH